MTLHDFWGAVFGQIRSLHMYNRIILHFCVKHGLRIQMVFIISVYRRVHRPVEDLNVFTKSSSSGECSCSVGNCLSCIVDLALLSVV